MSDSNERFPFVGFAKDNPQGPPLSPKACAAHGCRMVNVPSLLVLSWEAGVTVQPADAGDEGSGEMAPVYAMAMTWVVHLGPAGLWGGLDVVGWAGVPLFVLWVILFLLSQTLHRWDQCPDLDLALTQDCHNELPALLYPPGLPYKVNLRPVTKGNGRQPRPSLG